MHRSKIPMPKWLTSPLKGNVEVDETYDGAMLRKVIREAVDRDSLIITDERGGYRCVGRYFTGGHEKVMHSAGEYVRGDASTNTSESFFALLKRGIVEAFHSINKCLTYEPVVGLG